MNGYPRLIVVLLGVVAVVATVSACGGSHDRDPRQGGETDEAEQNPATTTEAGSSTARAAGRDDPVVSGGTRAQIQEVVDDVQDGLADGDGWSICAELSSAAETRMLRSAGGSRMCSAIVEATLAEHRAKGITRTRSRIVSLQVGDPAAMATVRDRSGETYRVRFLREGRAWVLPRVNLRAPSGLARIPTGPPPDPPVTGARRQAAEAIEDLQQALVHGPGAMACGELTGSAQESVRRTADKPGASCAEAVEAHVARWRQRAVEPVVSKIERVRLVDDGAVVTVRDPGREPYGVKILGYEYGLWLLPELNLSDPSGLQPLGSK